MTLSNDVDLLNPPAEVEKMKYKLKRLVQSRNSFFFFMVTHKLCDLSSTIEWKKMNGDKDEDEKNDEIDYKRLKSDSTSLCHQQFPSATSGSEVRFYITLLPTIATTCSQRQRSSTSINDVDESSMSNH
nr:40S ribosomal protein S27-2 [Tanacetum cinerariifolium]